MIFHAVKVSLQNYGKSRTSNEYLDKRRCKKINLDNRGRCISKFLFVMFSEFRQVSFSFEFKP